MSTRQRQNFVTQVDPDLIKALRGTAKEEGLQVQTLIDEALSDLIEKRRLGKLRKHVMAAYNASISSYGKLYQRLAE